MIHERIRVYCKQWTIFGMWRSARYSIESAFIHKKVYYCEAEIVSLRRTLPLSRSIELTFVPKIAYCREVEIFPRGAFFC